MEKNRCRWHVGMSQEPDRGAESTGCRWQKGTNEFPVRIIAFLIMKTPLFPRARDRYLTMCTQFYPLLCVFWATFSAGQWPSNQNVAGVSNQIRVSQFERLLWLLDASVWISLSVFGLISVSLLFRSINNTWLWHLWCKTRFPFLSLSISPATFFDMPL